LVPNCDDGDKEEEGIEDDSEASGWDIWGLLTINRRKEDGRNSSRKVPLVHVA
jgi:hypothetical protein